MKYQLERLENIAQSQQLLGELFTFIGEKADPNLYLTENPQAFFRLWGGNDPLLKLRVFTARNEQGKLSGVVMIILLENPLFLTKPFLQRLVNLTENDPDFEDYINVIMEAW